MPKFSNRIIVCVTVAIIFLVIVSCYAKEEAVAEAVVAKLAVGSSARTVNEFFDKTLPEEETYLTEADFRHQNGKLRNRRELAANTQQNEKSAITVTKAQPSSSADSAAVDDSAMYNANRFEGDIVNPGLNSKTLNSFIEDETNLFISASRATIDGDAVMIGGKSVMRNAVRQPYLKWPNARIPYTISKQYTAAGRQRIAEAFKEYKDRSCVEFAPKAPTDLDYVHILPDEGCYSLVGKVGGKQPVSLGNGCMHKGIIIHELMHAVGFFHEQSRADRDEYIKIKWENVEHGLEDQFDKYSLHMIDHLGTKYDYGSVMHYGATAFSRNGQPTIETVQKGVRIGQRIGFSAIDLYKINKLYACPNADLLKGSADDTVVPTLRTVLSISDTGKATVKILPAVGETPPPPPPPPLLPPLAPQSMLPVPTPLPTACVDLRADCGILASRGHCESIFSSAYMTSNCVKSCEKCELSGGQLVAGSGNIDECRDRRTWCPGWAASGLCDFYVFQQYMHAKCAQSCGLCK